MLAFDRAKEREDLEREQLARNTIYLGQPYTVCGEPLHNITPYLLSVLTVARNPFAIGGSIRLAHVAQFLWALHVDYSPSAWWKKRQLMKRASRLEIHSSVAEIQSFLEITFMDQPHGISKEKPIASDTAWLVFRFRHEPWGMKKEETIHTPFRELYQELRCWRRENTEDYIENPSDTHIKTYGEKINEALEKGRRGEPGGITQAQLDEANLRWRKEREKN